MFARRHGFCIALIREDLVNAMHEMADENESVLQNECVL
jgi:hypothetical protein